MQHLQIWLPTLLATGSADAERRDAQRAFSEWGGEAVVWLLPGLGSAVRWVEGPLERCLAVPAATLSRLVIYHVGANGRVWGLGAAERFQSGQLDDLLDIWLNLPGEGGMALYPAPRSYTVDVPYIKGDCVRYEEQTFQFQPGPTVPIVATDDDTQTVYTAWPPPGSGLPRPPVSPAAESVEFYGPLRREEDELWPAAVSERDPDFRSFHCVIRWPGALAPLFRLGAGVDDLFAQTKMAEIARRSADDLEGALQEANVMAAPYLTEGHSTREAVWMWPLFVASQEAGGTAAVLDEAKFHFGLSLGDWQATVQSKEWQDLMKQPVPVRRAWGPIGLFAALLLERLKQRRAFRVCEGCGRIMEGRRNKRFCGRADNLTCFRERQAERQRHSRATRQAKNTGSARSG